ncbi:hypothetical protein SAMN05421595_2010 [Austwickia chelonae]|nr:hypothetical protein SAMN05421595_2010 [Austwickia chelonae]
MIGVLWASAIREDPDGSDVRAGRRESGQEREFDG